MKRTEAKNVGQIINDLLKKENLDVALDEHRASALWPQIVGDGINRYTIRRYVKDGVMTVHLSSASLAKRPWAATSSTKSSSNNTSQLFTINY